MVANRNSLNLRVSTRKLDQEPKRVKGRVAKAENLYEKKGKFKIPALQCFQRAPAHDTVGVARCPSSLGGEGNKRESERMSQTRLIFHDQFQSQNMVSQEQTEGRGGQGARGEEKAGTGATGRSELWIKKGEERKREAQQQEDNKKEGTKKEAFQGKKKGPRERWRNSLKRRERGGGGRKREIRAGLVGLVPFSLGEQAGLSHGRWS